MRFWRPFFILDENRTAYKFPNRKKINGSHLLSFSVVGLQDRPKTPPPPHGGVKMAFWSSPVPPTSYTECGQIFHVDLTLGFFFGCFGFRPSLKSTLDIWLWFYYTWTAQLLLGGDAFQFYAFAALFTICKEE